MNGMTSRGMNYWESADGGDQRLIFAMDSLLQELDAKTGRPIVSFGTNGVVDLRAGIDGRDPATIGNIQSTIPGEVFENLVILGSATATAACRHHPRLLSNMPADAPPKRPQRTFQSNQKTDKGRAHRP